MREGVGIEGMKLQHQTESLRTNNRAIDTKTGPLHTTLGPLSATSPGPSHTTTGFFGMSKTVAHDIHFCSFGGFEGLWGHLRAKDGYLGAEPESFWLLCGHGSDILWQKYVNKIPLA